MNKRIFLVGLVAGLLVSGALYYPLYCYLPSKFVPGWSSAEDQVAIVFLAIAGFLLLGTGAIAGRMSGARNRLGAMGAGSAAGLTAALLAELLVGGAAAGVWGARLLVAHGLQATSNQAEFLDLLSYSVSSIVWWSYLSVWVATIAGLLLGGAGGLAAGKGGKPAHPQPGLWLSVTAAGALAAAINLIVMAIVYTTLGQVTQRVADKIAEEFIDGYLLPYPSESMLWWAVATSLVWLTFWQFAAWRIPRDLPASRSMAFLFIGAALLLAPVGLLVFLAWLLYTSILEPISLYFVIAGFGVILAMSILFLWTALKIRQRLPPKTVPETRLRRAWSKGMSVFERVGRARASAGYFLFISLGTTLLVYGIDQEALLLPWLTGGLLLNILIAALGMRAAWKSGPPPADDPVFPTTADFCAGAGLGGSFFAILSLINCMALLNLVLLPVVTIPVLLHNEESAAVAAAGSQTMASIVQASYLTNLAVVIAAGLVVAIVTVLVTASGTLWIKYNTHHTPESYPMAKLL